MESATVSSCILTLHRRFAAYTTQRLQELGLSFGMMYFVIYVGKHPGCTPSELTQRLHLDWGHTVDVERGLTADEQRELLDLLQKAAQKGSV